MIAGDFDDDVDIFLEAAVHGEWKLVDDLLNRGVTMKKGFCCLDTYRSMQGLYKSILHGHICAAKELSKCNCASANDENHVRFYTKMLRAVFCREFLADRIRSFPALLQCVLSHGADPNVLLFDDMPPLRLCTLSKSLASAMVLLYYGADVNAIYGERTVLHTAVLHERTAFVRLLLECGADPNIQDIHGYPPLYVACYHVERNYDIIYYLLKYGADPYLRCAQTSAYMSADDKLAAFLSSRGASHPEPSHVRFPAAFLMAGIKCDADKEVGNTTWLNIIRFLIKRVVADLPVSKGGFAVVQRLLQAKSFLMNWHFHGVHQYKAECLRELKQLKENISGTSKSYYDILKDSTDVIKLYATNNYIFDALSPKNWNSLKKQYPVYFDGLLFKYRGGLKDALDKEVACFYLHQFFREKLPILCVHKICTYLTNSDCITIKDLGNDSIHKFIYKREMEEEDDFLENKKVKLG